MRTPVLKGLQSRNSEHLLQSVLHARVGRDAGLGVSMGTLCILGKKSVMQTDFTEYLKF